MQKLIILLILLNNFSSLEKKYLLKPLEKICEGIDGEKKEILTFYIRCKKKPKNIKVFFQENRKITKIIKKKNFLKKELIYEVIRGGVIELCLKNLEKKNSYKIEIDSFRGLFAFKKNKIVNLKDVSQALDKGMGVLQELVKGFTDVVNQEEMNYIVRKTFYEKVLDSLAGKN